MRWRSKHRRPKPAGATAGLFALLGLCSVAAAQPALPPLPDEPGFERLDVPRYLSAVIAWPQTPASAPLPIAVALHGSYDQPEWNCESFQQVVRGAAVVLCPRGRLRWDSPKAADLLRFFFPSPQGVLLRELLASVEALRLTFPQQIDSGPILYIGFSQGAIFGAPEIIRNPRLFPRAILIEGGHSAWNSATAQSYRRGGGQRVLFACGRDSCNRSAIAAARYLASAGVLVKVVYSPDQGHTYTGGVQDVITAEFPWLVDGDPRFRFPEPK
jgi:predicted esterase